MRYCVKYNAQKFYFNNHIKVLDIVGNDKRFICCYVNNRLRELTYEINEDSTIEVLTSKDADARQIYNASLRFIVCMAMKEICPSKQIRFLNGISRSLFVRFVDEEEFSENLIKNLDKKMREIVSQDFPFIRKKISKDDAYALFIKEGYKEKASMIKYRPEETCHIYLCNNYVNYMYNRMTPSTGYISRFNLIKYGGGVIIQYPRYDKNGEIPPFENAPNFNKTLQDADIWAKVTKANTVLGINKKIETGGEIDFINLSEARHNRQLAQIGDMIEERKSVRIIYIAGPSSSGKTTFANRLKIELLSRGLEPIRISLDDYYVDHDKLPLDEKGETDYETIDAFDISSFNKDIENLIKGKKVKLPIFSFEKGTKIDYKEYQLNEDQPIIVEGIHALNNKLTSSVKSEQIYRIFIAPTAQISLDNENPLSSTDLRLLRRIVRDHKYRSTSILETLMMWPNVRKGEFKWIYQTQENADYVFNSFLPYELCVLKKYALPLLNEINMDSVYFPTAERLIRMLKFFNEIDEKWIPHSSLIREFIGGSCYQDV